MLREEEPAVDAPKNGLGNTDRDYGRYYSESAFWRFLGRAGNLLPFLEEVLALYFCLLDRDTPAHVKATIVGALGYVIFPFDLILDTLVPLGWTDDAAVVMAAYTYARCSVKEEHRRKARDVAMCLRVFVGAPRLGWPSTPS